MKLVCSAGLLASVLLGCGGAVEAGSVSVEGPDSTTDAPSGGSPVWNDDVRFVAIARSGGLRAPYPCTDVVESMYYDRTNRTLMAPRCGPGTEFAPLVRTLPASEVLDLESEFRALRASPPPNQACVFDSNDIHLTVTDGDSHHYSEVNMDCEGWPVIEGLSRLFQSMETRVRK